MADFEFEDPFNDDIEDILSSLFSQVEDLWPDPTNRPDTREGSLLWTLFSPVAFEIQRFQTDLNFALELGFLQYTTDEYLDLKGVEVGLDRKQGSEAVGPLRFFGEIGTVIPSGTNAANEPATEDDEVYSFLTSQAVTIKGVDDPDSVNEKQKITVSGAGRFTLTLDGQTTIPLSADATGNDISTALDALSTAKYPVVQTSGDAGIANSGGATVTFEGGNVGGTNVEKLVAAPYKVNEIQNVYVPNTGACTYKITFDGVETSTTLDQDATGSNLVAKINSLSPHVTYGVFSVSCSIADQTKELDAVGGVSIIFDGGGVAYKDVPLIEVTSKSANVGTPAITESTKGENSSSVIEVDEVIKGRAAKPIASTTDRNEVQRLTFTKPQINVEVVNEGVENNTNQIQRLTIPNGPAVIDGPDVGTELDSDGAPNHGSFKLKFTNNLAPAPTPPTIEETLEIEPTFNAANIKSRLESLSTIDVGDVSVTLVSGGPTIADGNAVFDIEFKNNLRNHDFPVMQVVDQSLNVKVNEKQSVRVVSPTPSTTAYTYKITFDDEETATTLNQDSTGADLVTAINSLSPHPEYGTFTVSCSTADQTKLVSDASGIEIVFDGGGVAYKNVPLLKVTSKIGMEGETIALQSTATQSIQTFQVTGSGSYSYKLVFGVDGVGDPVVGSVVLNQASTGADLVNALNAMSPHPIFGVFSVSCSPSDATKLISAGGGITINFNVSNLSYIDVPLIFIDVVTGSPSESQSYVAEGTLNFIQSFKVSGSGTYDYKITFDGVESTAVLDQNSTGLDLKNALNSLTLGGSLAGTVFDVTPQLNQLDSISGVSVTITPTTLLASVPLIQVTSKTDAMPEETITLALAGGPNDPDNPGDPDLRNFTPDAVISIRQNAANGGNEEQKIYFTDILTPGYGPVPDGGTISITVQDELGNGSQTTSAIPYNASASAIKAALEALPTYGAANNSFSVTGSDLVTGPINVKFTGINKFTPFKKMLITSNFTGVTSTGTYKLKYGGNSTSTASISVSASTQQVETAINNDLGANTVKVYVANGVQTITYSSGTPTSGTFKLLIDDGSSTQTTDTIDWNTTAAALETKINAKLALMGAGREVKVYPSVGTPATTTLSTSGVKFTINFLDANVNSYKHLAVVDNLLNPATTLGIGPTLVDSGAAYEVKFAVSGPRSAFTANTVTGFSPGEENMPPVIKNSSIDGSSQILTLSRPASLFKLGWGSVQPLKTTYISPLFDTLTTIKHKIEAIGGITSDVSVTYEDSGATNMYESPIKVTFSGVTLASQPLDPISVDRTLVSGGYLGDSVEVVSGFGSGAGQVSGTVQYVYSIVTKLGYQESPSDADYEEGYGYTGASIASDPISVSNQKVSVEIAPIPSGEGLYEPKKINVYRKLTQGFTSSPFKLIDTIEGNDLKTTELNDELVTPSMFIIDNVPLSLFNASNNIAPTSNTTGVVDVESTAEEVGSGQNLNAKEVTVLQDFITGVEKVTNPEAFGGGADVESDDDYRARMIEFIQRDPGAGNIDDYISWAKEIDGVSGASVIPEWQEIYGPLEGAGTVKVIVFGENSTTLPDNKVEEVRQYIMGTPAIEDPDQDSAPAISTASGGNIEPGTYEYCYSFLNVGKGETNVSALATIEVTSGNQTVELSIETGPTGVGVQNTIGRRIYRKKTNGAVSGQPESEKLVLVAELLNNEDLTYVDSAAFVDLPTWRGAPSGPYERRKAPLTNSTSLYDGQAPIGAHVTVQSITEETVWVGVTVYPGTGYSLDGSGGTTNLSDLMNSALSTYFTELKAGEDIRIVNIANVLHDLGSADLPAIKDFKDLTLYSPAYPEGTTSNISVGPGVSAAYSSAGKFSLWTSYPYDK